MQGHSQLRAEQDTSRQGHGGVTARPCLSALSSQCKGKHGNGNVSSVDKESRNVAAYCAQQLPLCAREIAGEIGNSTYKEGNWETPPNFSFNAVCWYPGPLLNKFVYIYVSVCL